MVQRVFPAVGQGPGGAEVSTTLDPMAQALKKRGQTPGSAVGGVPTMWECSSCGEEVDAMVASIHPGSLKLYHGNGTGVLCGPLLTPTESRHRTTADREVERGRLDTKRAAEVAAHVCEHCGEMITRRRSSSGNLQKRKDWLAKRFCNSSCSLSARNSKQIAAAATTNAVRKGVERKRACMVCGEHLSRKRRPGGKLEELREFKKRVTCGMSCGQKWAWQSRERKRKRS